ncbi:MAG: hypothetical protein U9R03_02670 [Candidatus Aerophobetes bacterium]|nr:hypothetical protein [Candidatus Aerophobetes bacterium]
MRRGKFLTNGFLFEIRFSEVERDNEIGKWVKKANDKDFSDPQETPFSLIDKI